MVVSRSVEKRQLVGIPTTLHCIQRMAFVCSLTIMTTYDKYARVYSSQTKALEPLVERWKSRAIHLLGAVNVVIPIHPHIYPATQELVEAFLDLDQLHTSISVF